jgi:hypothetical protein
MIYAELLPDSTIMKNAESYDSMTLVVCPVCANTSVGYQKNLPVLKKSVDETTGETTYIRTAITGEAHRIKELLDEKDKDVKIEMYGAPCAMAMDKELPRNLNGGDADTKLVEQCADTDAVLALCCSVGVLGLKRRLGGSTRIVPCMKTRGFSQFSFKFDDNKELVYVDRESSTVLSSFQPSND